MVVLTWAALAGVTRTGVDGAASEVEFVIDPFGNVPVAAALPVGTARSRIIGFEPGLV